jgi:diguanylate cyclase (GGDEF)-like protein
MKDIRYSELVFLREIGKGDFEYFTTMNKKQLEAVGLQNQAIYYIEMAVTLLEDLYVCFQDSERQLFVARLRGELGPRFNNVPSRAFPDYYWDNPREGLENILNGLHGGIPRLRITYRGLRRIEELRDILRYERVLEPCGILLSMQYFLRDLDDSLRSGPDAPVSVIHADMDNFKRINTEFGYKAGDEVMKSYLEVVRDSLGILGEAYRGVGDEVSAIIMGQGHAKAIEIAEKIRKGVENLRCQHKGTILPPVTASIGVATTPPETRTADVENVAQQRIQQAKDKGKNRVIA